MSDRLHVKAPAAETWAGELSDMEVKADVECLADLQAQRRALVTANAKLIALHGAFGHYEAHRARMEKAMEIKARMMLQALAPDKKPTDEMVKAHGRGSDEYGKFIDDALSEKVEWLLVDDAITILNERISNRTMALSLYGKEAGLR